MKAYHLAIVVGLVAASAASAATQTVTANVIGLTDLFSTAQLPQFDPSLGTLQSVTFHAQAFVAGDYTFTNVSGGSKRTRVDYVDWQIDVTGFGGPTGNLIHQDWVTPPTVDNPFGDVPGHYNLPLTGLIPVGTTIGPFEYGTSQVFDQTYTSGNAEFASFIGTSTTPFNIAVPVLFQIAVFGSGQQIATLSTQAGLNITATYTYAVPAPAAAGLLGLAGVVAGRRRRVG